MEGNLEKGKRGSSVYPRVEVFAKWTNTARLGNRT